MNAQKFIAPTLKEALNKVRAALGDDAIILKSEKLEPASGLGFMKKDLIEITAARPEDVKSDAQSSPEFAEALNKSIDSAPVKESAPRYDIALLNEEVKRLRGEIGTIGKFFKYNNLPAMPEALMRTWETLSGSGVEREWATDLAQEALIHLNANDLISASRIADFMLNRISSVIPPAVNQPVKRNRSYKIAVVGSPGAGKTTTLQKLLADPVAYAKRKVGLLSFDTHRLAAIEQMRTFARVAGAPLEVIYSVDQIPDALSRLSQSELILIDTPGCTSDPVRFEQVRELVEAVDSDEIHLVLNSSVRDEEMIHTCQRFRDMKITHLTFTRLDESLKHGYLLNVARVAAKPVAWLCNGQNFSGNLQRFSTSNLAEWTKMSSEQPALARAAV